MYRRIRSYLFYLFVVLLFGGLMWGIADLGRQYQDEAAEVATVTQTPIEGLGHFLKDLGGMLGEPLPLLLLQILTILFVARLMSSLCAQIGQPSVIGEILAGILLGPSVLAHIAPDVSTFLFSPESLGNLEMLSKFGLVLFMFVIGLELDLAEMRARLKDSVLISHTSMIVPFFCGMVLAYFVYPYYVPSSVPFLSFAMFMGIAMCVTAFPVLARIIQERGMTHSKLGKLALASAANGDLTAWMLLAVVIAMAQAGSMLSALYTILALTIYLCFMFLIVRPFLAVVGKLYHNKEVMNKAFVAFIFMVLLLSAYITEVLGVHALFGSFVAGVVMPANTKFRSIMTEKVEDISLTLFLPLFFVSTGLKTEIGLLNSPEMWLVCLLFIIVAVVGKFGGTLLAARFVGESWLSSFRLGALMNTRGVTELVVLSIGLELGVLPDKVFVILVLMTLLTTFMTTPLMSVIDWFSEVYNRVQRRREAAKPTRIYRLLLSFGRASSGAALLEVARQLFGYGRRELQVTALHVTEGTDLNPLHASQIEETTFAPIRDKATALHIPIDTRYQVSHNATEYIVEMAADETFDFLLIGAGIRYSTQPEDHDAMIKASSSNSFGQLFYPGKFLEDKTEKFVARATCNVGVLVNRNFTTISHLVVLLFSPTDSYLLYNVERLVAKNDMQITLMDPSGILLHEQELSERFNKIDNDNEHFSISSLVPLTLESLIPYDFMLIGAHSWNYLRNVHGDLLANIPSSLVIYHKEHRSAEVPQS